MKPSDKISVYKQLFLTFWAMATLILCFVVVLLINEMLKRGENPLAAFNPDTQEWPASTGDEAWRLGPVGTRDVALYFAGEDGHWLVPENLVVEYNSRTVENCRSALEGLVTGPKNELLLSLLPKQTQIRALYLRDDGELTIDLSSEMLTSQSRPRSAEMEALMVYGIVNTMTQPALVGEDNLAVRTVRFLFDGAPPLDTFPAHLDLSAPLAQDGRWTRAGIE